jgi:hypothetical protein
MFTKSTIGLSAISLLASSVTAIHIKQVDQDVESVVQSLAQAEQQHHQKMGNVVFEKQQNNLKMNDLGVDTDIAASQSSLNLAETRLHHNYIAPGNAAEGVSYAAFSNTLEDEVDMSNQSLVQSEAEGSVNQFYVDSYGLTRINKGLNNDLI